MITERLAAFVLRLLRAPCGDFGGHLAAGRTRWCLKPFGHEDSHAYDITEQPLRRARLRAQGYDITQETPR